MFKKLLDSNNPWDIYIIARWCYKNGIEFLDDVTVFDPLEDILKEQDPYNELFQRSYMDDEEPSELLTKYNINLSIAKSKKSTRLEKYYDILLDTKGISVRPVRDLETAYLWYKNYKGVPIVHSIKMNGVNTKSIFSVKQGKILVSASKASDSANFLDYTDAVQSYYPSLNTNFYKNIKRLFNTDLIAYCEAYVDSIGLKILKEQYGISYVTARSAALGVLQKNYVSLIPNNIHVVCYNCPDNLGDFETGLLNAQKIGFDIVKYRVDTFIDTGFDDFCLWIKEIQDDLGSYADNHDIPYDGIVAQVNSMEEYYKHYTTMYNDSNIALKFGKTGAEVIKARVKHIPLIQSSKASVQYTCKIILEPVVTRDGNTISEITGYTLDNVISKGIKPGDIINIIYQSGCYPTLE